MAFEEKLPYLAACVRNGDLLLALPV